MLTALRLGTLKATSTWDRDTTPEAKYKTRRFKEESRPDGQHRDIFKGNIRTCLKRQIFNSGVLPVMTYGTHHPCRQQASSRTEKDGKEYVKHHIPGKKNKHLGKKKDKGHRRD